MHILSCPEINVFQSFLSFDILFQFIFMMPQTLYLVYLLLFKINTRIFFLTEYSVKFGSHLCGSVSHVCMGCCTWVSCRKEVLAPFLNRSWMEIAWCVFNFLHLKMRCSFQMNGDVIKNQGQAPVSAKKQQVQAAGGYGCRNRFNLPAVPHPQPPAQAERHSLNQHRLFLILISQLNLCLS